MLAISSVYPEGCCNRPIHSHGLGVKDRYSQRLG
jgi:hypothetical protein